MPITFEQIVNDRVEVSVTFSGQTAKVWFRPNAITPRFAKLLAGTARPEMLAEALTKLVDEWEITRAGKPYPLTEEALIDLPFNLLTEVFAKIMDASTDSGQASNGTVPRAEGALGNPPATN